MKTLDTEYRDFLWCGILIVFALAIRVTFYTGIFGSDEVTYVLSSIKFLEGDVSGDTYVGAIRYGVNLPIAFFIALFGKNEFTANIWPMMAGVLEVVVAYLLAKRLTNHHVAVWTALLLATVPVHVHFSGRMMADTPLSFLLALAVLLFVKAEQEGSKQSHLLSGIAFGFTYWVKASVTVILSPLFVFYALWCRTFKRNWVYFIGGGLLVWLGHFVLMWLIHGHPLHLLTSIFAAVDRVSGGESATTPLYYLGKLFIDVKHLWLLGFIALAGVVIAWKQRKSDHRIMFCWLLWVPFVLSFLTLRQTNYLLLFLVPLCFFAAIAITSIRHRLIKVLVIATWFAFALLLSGLKQQDIRAHTANAKALFNYVADKQVVVAGSQKVANIHNLKSALHHSDVNSSVVVIGEDEAWQHADLIVLDKQTSNTSLENYVDTWIAERRMCVTPLPTIPARSGGAGYYLVESVRYSVDTLLPQQIGNKVSEKLSQLFSTGVMNVYAHAPDCSEAGTSNGDPLRTNVEHVRKISEN